MKNIILGLICLGAILCIVYFFVIEGFQGVTAGDMVQAKCAANTTCSACLATPNCGWASEYASPVSGLQGVADGSVLACIPMSGGMPFITSNLNALMIKRNGAISKLNKFVSTMSDCTDVTCTSKNSCSACVTYKKCTWRQVVAADTSVTQSCMDLSGAPAAGSTSNNITDKSKCPAPQCSDLTDCQDCANATGCGYCSTSGKCLKTSEFGSGTNKCPSSSLVSVASQCPCAGITDCVKCASRAGCAYCKGIQQCVNMDKFGMPPVNTCSPDDAATSGSQCSAGSLPRLPQQSETIPTIDNLAAAQNSGIIDRASGFDLGAMQNTGNGPVSPSTSYTSVTAPGVARPLGASSIPATVRNGADTGSPLESYVKMLVNSQLAAQGVPTNEPFQSSEATAIPNATDYMKKVFRGVFS